jgi:hypothetical protein
MTYRHAWRHPPDRPISRTGKKGATVAAVNMFGREYGPACKAMSVSAIARRIGMCQTSLSSAASQTAGGGKDGANLFDSRDAFAEG